MSQGQKGPQVSKRASAGSAQRSRKFALVALCFEVLMIILYGLFVEYEEGTADAKSDPILANGQVSRYYGPFQDVHVMIFVGFGFLMTFLSKYGFGAVGLNFMLSAMSVQWGMFLVGAFHWIHAGKRSNIQLSMVYLIEGDFAAGAVLISFGALLGKTSPLQMMCLAFSELVFYNINYLIGALELGAMDMGGSMFVHTFGAYFGLGAAWILGRKSRDSLAGHKRNGSSKMTDTFAMIGTLFLWMFWPSFNSALAPPESQHRVILNTVLALCGSCVGAFLFSNLMRKGKFSMVDIQNATLAGGVAIGSAADMVVQPWAATLIGVFASGVSVWGYTYLMEKLEDKIGLFDTCGVHNLHGMPGLVGGITGALASATVGNSVYGTSVGTIYPGRAECTPETLLQGDVCGRSALQQAGIQLLALLITVCIAVSSGALTAKILQHPFFQPIPEEGLFSDHLDWDDVEEEDEIIEHHAGAHDHKGRAIAHDHVAEQEPHKIYEDISRTKV